MSSTIEIDQPQQRVWVGEIDDPARPADAQSPTQHACCGSCYPTFVECVAPALRAVLNVFARSICEHQDSGLLCAACGLRVLMLADRVRNSFRFSMDIRTEWGVATSVLIAANLLSDVDAADLIALADDGGDEGSAEQLLEILLTVRHLDEAAAHRAVDLFFPAASATGFGLNQPIRPVQPRLGTAGPPRKGYHRGELAIAERQGWPEPQRHMVERRVRAAAVAAWSEADFIRGMVADGLGPLPRLTTSGFGVCGYSVAALDISNLHRRTFAGASLAADLTLPSLRQAWTSEPTDADAWGTWVSMTAPQVADAQPLQPATPADGGWRWLHPSLPKTSAPVDLDRWPAGSRPPRAVVWETLFARQGGRCAMCSIRWHQWQRIFGTRLPEGLLVPPQHVDHDWDTGLVRGLLCVRCNTVQEPREAGFDGDIRRAYVADPPARPYEWHYYMSTQRH